MFHNRRMELAWIKQRLGEIKKNQSGLAAVLGIDPPRVSEMLKGRREIQPDEIVPTANFLELSVADTMARIFPGQVKEAHAYTNAPPSPDVHKYPISEDVQKIVHDSVLEAFQIAQDHDLEFAPEEFAKLAADRARIYLEIKRTNPDMGDQGVDAATHAALDNIIRNIKFG